MTIPCHLDFISVNKYGDGDGIALEKDVAIPVEGRHVILVDDTVDTGLTLQYVVKTPARARARIAGRLHAPRPPAQEDCGYRNQV